MVMLWQMPFLAGLGLKRPFSSLLVCQIVCDGIMWQEIAYYQSKKSYYHSSNNPKIEAVSDLHLMKT